MNGVKFRTNNGESFLTWSIVLTMEGAATTINLVRLLLLLLRYQRQYQFLGENTWENAIVLRFCLQAE